MNILCFVHSSLSSIDQLEENSYQALVIFRELGRRANFNVKFFFPVFFGHRPSPFNDNTNLEGLGGSIFGGSKNLLKLKTEKIKKKQERGRWQQKFLDLRLHHVLEMSMHKQKYSTKRILCSFIFSSVHF